MLSRRQLIASLTAATALAPMRAFADGRCVVLSPTLRQCTVGLELGVDIAQQRCESWCWAASIEAIFAMHNRPVPQEVIVEKMFGSDPNKNCRGASQQDIVDAVSGGWVDENGREFQAYGEILPLAWMGVRTPDQTVIGTDPTDPANLALAMTEDMFSSGDLRVMIDELANENPLIIQSAGGGLAHAVVLTAVTFLQSNTGNLALTELVVRDPWPGSPNRRIYTEKEVTGTYSVIKVSVR